MKKTMIILAAIALATPSLAVVIPEGTHEIGFAGAVDSDTPQGTDISFDLKYGMFLMDQFVLGGTLGVTDNDTATTWDIGVYGEYNWDTQTEWVPYVGLDGTWSSVDPASGDSADAFVATPNVGVKYFFNESVAAYGQFNYDLATDDIYVDEDLNAESTNYGIMLGLRIYLGQ